MPQIASAQIVMIAAALSLVGSGLTQSMIHWMPRRTGNIQSVNGGDSDFYGNAQNGAPVYNMQLHGGGGNNNRHPFSNNNNQNNQMQRSSAAVANNNNYNNAPTCITPLGAPGLCVSLQVCSEVLTLYTRLQTAKATEYSVVLQNLCGRRITADNYPVVCCTQSSLHMVTPIKTPDTVSKEKDDKEPVEEEEEEEPATTRRSATTPSTTRRPNTRRTTKKTTTTQTPARGRSTRNCSRLMRDEASDQPDWANHIDVRLLDSDPCPSSSDDDDHTEESVTSRNQRSSTPRTSADDDSYPFVTEKQNCGFVQQTPQISRIVGGWESSIGEWPWLVLLGYDPHSLAPFKCGGTLVTSRHVVTAAHCILKELSFIRLGEFDLSMENETDYIDVNVAKTVTHPDFREYKYDIAVVLMDHSVEFSDIIRPICMPTSQYMRTKSFVKYNPFVAGWGRTMEGGSGSTKVNTLQIPIHENNICRNAYLSQNVRESHHAFDETIVCAGVLAGGQDTCQGDSGGPLMIPEPFKGITRYYLLGIVSYGLGCGRVGIPGIYTSTQHYIDWISQQVREM